MRASGSLFLLASALVAGQSQVPTFHKDVQPILQARCQECHRPGEIGRMPLLTYEQARPWAKSMKASVLQGKMPPWPADPSVGHFANDRTLPKAQIETIVQWADGGAPAGNPKDSPAARQWREGWNIAPPDLVVSMPEAFPVPAKGEVEYQYIVVPTGFTEDKWVQAVEVRPANRGVVHHAVVYLREPKSKWLREAPVGKAFVPSVKTAEERGRNTGGGDSEFLTTYTPGMVPDIWEPGQAKLIKAGSDFVFQMHYTANGKAGEDQTRIGLVFAKEPPKQRVLTMTASNNKIKIPAGAPDYMATATTAPLNEATLLSLFPHLHLRGKAFQYEALFPDGSSKTLFKLSQWDLGWQLSYKLAEPLKLPAGTRIRATGWWDNSANNRANPDPSKEVGWGEQSWEEMMVGFFDMAFEVERPLSQVYLKK